MEKKTLRAVMAALLMAAVPAYAGSYTVTAEQAKAMVRAWSAENQGGFGLSGATVVAAKPFADADGTVLWYAVTLDDGSCVFTAADSRVEPVIAVVPNCGGTLPAAHPLRAMLEADLRGRLAAVKGASGASLQSVSPAATQIAKGVKAARAKWARYAGGAALQDVPAAVATASGNPPLTYAYLPGFCSANESLMYLTHWNQTYEKTSYDEKRGTWPLTSVQAPLYNYYTPMHYVCGCVATAGATILQYFGTPSGKSGVEKVCTVNGEPVKLKTVGGAYNWAILPQNMGGQAANVDLLNEAQRELLGRVTYDMGVSVGMMYTQTESGAFGSALAPAFKDNFGFATAENVGFGLLPPPKGSPAYAKPIYHQLRAGAPVVLSILSGSGGHEVVAVGYGKDVTGGDYTRVFMGWGGSSDAWYQLPEIQDYKMVSDVTTMLSRDGACVAYCGRVLLPRAEGAVKDQGVVGAKIEVAGVTNVLTGANGLFGFRLPLDKAKDVRTVTISYGDFSEEVELQVGGEAIEDDADFSDPQKHPDEIVFTLPEDVDAVPDCESPADAVARAMNSDPIRMVCLVSGRNGDRGSEAVKAFIAENAAAFNEKYVLYYADWETDGYYLQDALPSIGVFNPLLFDPAMGWSMGNGCLGYLQGDVKTNLIAKRDLQALLDETSDKWTRLQDGIVLGIRAGAVRMDRQVLKQRVLSPYVMSKGKTEEEVFGMRLEDLLHLPEKDLLAKLDELAEEDEKLQAAIKEVHRYDKWVDIAVPCQPAAGDYADKYANGETVAFSATAKYRDVAAGTEYACTGWELWSATDGLVDSGSGTKVSVDMSDPELTLRWIVEESAFRVKARTQLNTTAECDATVSPADTWVAAGATVEIVALPAAGGEVFKDWSECGKGMDPKSGDLVACRTSSVARIVAYQPRELVATFQSGEYVDGTGTVTVNVKPAALASVVPKTSCGSVALTYGSARELPAAQVSLAPAKTNFVDSAGTNWVLVGWSDGKGGPAATSTEARATFSLAKGAKASLTWVWEAVVPEIDVPTNYSIEWTNSLDNLNGSYETNLVTVSQLANAGLTVADLEVTAPEGFKAIVVEEGDNVVAKLQVDEEVLTPVAGSSLTIEPQADGSVLVQGTVLNGVKGFWYSLYSADDLTGPWLLVGAGEYVAGVPAEQAPRNQEVQVTIAVEPVEAKKFYKLKVTDRNPEEIN